MTLNMLTLWQEVNCHNPCFCLHWVLCFIFLLKNKEAKQKWATRNNNTTESFTSLIDSVIAMVIISRQRWQEVCSILLHHMGNLATTLPFGTKRRVLLALASALDINPWSAAHSGPNTKSEVIMKGDSVYKPVCSADVWPGSWRLRWWTKLGMDIIVLRYTTIILSQRKNHLRNLSVLYGIKHHCPVPHSTTKCGMNLHPNL